MRDYVYKRIGNGPEFVGNMIKFVCAKQLACLKQVLSHHIGLGMNICASTFRIYHGKPMNDGWF